MGIVLCILSLWISWLMVEPRGFGGFLAVLMVSVVIDIVLMWVYAYIRALLIVRH